jgi:hypothetical protein
MAVVNTKSTVITNADATTQTLNSKALSGAVVKCARGTVETANGDDIASVYRFCRLPSHAKVVRIELWSDDIGTTTIADFGLYRTAADGGAVVDADAFGSAVSLKDGAVAGTMIQHESAVYGVEDVEQSLWQIGGATSDPKVMYDMCATLTGAADAPGTITLVVTYTDGD